MKHFTTTLILSSLLYTTSAMSAVPHLERHHDLAGQGCSDLRWTVDMEARKLTVQWKSAAGSTWTAFGISENGGMKGADVALVKSFGEGDFDVQDMVSTDFVLPELDIMQNVELLESFYDEQGRMTVTVQRDLDTCDDQDLQVKSHKQYLVCASGQLSEDGSPLYHGPHRSTGLVNLMVDEEVLFEQHFNGTLSDPVSLGSGITAHGDPQDTNTPFPVDFQMRNASLDTSVTTSYKCQVMNLTQPMTFTAYEGVWDDGMTLASGQDNDLMHHTTLYHCKTPSDLVSQHMDGQPWDCYNEMPVCDIAALYARGSGVLDVPSGIHFPLKEGTYVLLVHYENPSRQPVHNDTSGFRFWVEPPALNASTTKPAQIVGHDALYSSLQIPADPLQKELTLQYQISADATQQYLPEDGVQAFGGVLHMHKRGIRGKVELIRNGKHIMDVYNSMSYDFDRQTPDWARWKLLPGDALVVSCIYEPLKDEDVSGGLSTADEMCQFYVAWSPEIPNYGRAMGVLVKEGEPFLNTHMGDDIDVNARWLNYSDYRYAPNPPTRDGFEPLHDHRKDICRIMVRDELEINELTFADPVIIAQMIAIVAFVVTTLLSQKKVLALLGIPLDNLREQRNAIVYIGQLVFSTIALPIMLWELGSLIMEDESFQAVDPNPHALARGITSTQALLYLMELLYRVDIRGSLVLHHMTTALAVIYVNLAFMHTYSSLVFKFGGILTLLALTEQPLYLVLLFRVIGWREKLQNWWPTFCKIATAVFVLTRAAVVVTVVVLLVRQSGHNDIAWSLQENSFGDWLLPSRAFFENPTAFNAVTVVVTVSILISNYFAVSALMHMAKVPQGSRDDADTGDCQNDDYRMQASCLTQTDDDAIAGSEASSTSTPAEDQA